MPKISLVIPTYTLTVDLLNMVKQNIISFSDQVDELIVCEDGGRFGADLVPFCDVYAYFNKNVGFTANVNRGLKLATGDFIIVASSDTQLVAGELKDLCIDGKVTSPIGNQGVEGFWGAFFCIPKEVLEVRGLLKEEMRTYWSDVEYKERTKDIFQKVESVVINHNSSQTITVAGVEGAEELQKDMVAYKKLIADGKAK